MEKIHHYRKKVDDTISKYFVATIKNEKMKEMSEWALNGGKRLRSMIVLDINNSLNKINKTEISAEYLSITAELLHTSSLIIDDMPFMDNDNTRREKETIHYKYGNTSAQVLSIYLISKSIEFACKNLSELKKSKLLPDDEFNNKATTIINNILKQCKSAAYGQYIDTYPIKYSQENNISFTGKIKVELLREIITRKTAPFYDIAFVGSYLLSGGDINMTDDIHEISRLFGLIFQISDDFEDKEQDKEKSVDSVIQNYVVIVGDEEAYKHFKSYLIQFVNKLKKLNLYSLFFKEVISYLVNRVNKYYVNV